MILADRHVEDVDYLLMIAISVVLRQQYLASYSMRTCLGIVTPAFSQAWIKAEPAVIVSITISQFIQQFSYPLSRPFSHLSFESVLSQKRGSVTSFGHPPIVSSTSAGLLYDVLNDLKP